MNRNQIIEHLTKVNYIKQTCKVGGSLSDDLFQHTWLKILELEPTKLESIFEKGYLQFYIYRMIINEARNPANPFLKNYQQNLQLGVIMNSATNREQLEYGGSTFFEGHGLIDYSEEYDYDSDNDFEAKTKLIKEILDEQYFYDKKIFELYVEFGSLRKVEAQTGIKYGAIHQTVKKVKKIIHENITCRG